jgi:hypothetical protein
MMENLDTGSLFMFGSFLKNNNESNVLIYIALFYMIVSYCAKLIDMHKFEKYWKNKFNKYINYFFEKLLKENDITIELVSHSVQYTKGYSDKTISKNIFSPYFLGILYYFKKNIKNIKNLKNTTEILINKISDITRPSWKVDESKDEKFLLIPENAEIICINEELDIYLSIMTFHHNKEDEKDKTSSFEMKIYTKNYDRESFEKQKNKLYNFLEEKKKEYEQLSDQKDDNQYIFEYKCTEKCDDEINTKYNEFLMEHNKDLTKNIFFENKQKILDYIAPFKYIKDQETNDGEQCYINAGLTFKAGLLFYGSPGCGKTSTIKGILKYTNRHAIIVNLSNIQSNEELENVFRNRKINGKKYTGKELCFILEDCDATKLSTIQERNEQPILVSKDYIKNNDIDIDNDDMINLKSLVTSTKSKGFDLSCFLNVLDGIIELHGIMIIMTTNYPEKLDEALIRPGRIDFKHEFKKSNKQLIHNMLKLKYNKTDDEMKTFSKNIQNLKDYVLSPAQVQSICFKNTKIEDCLEDILLESQNV